jgi:hypothetical protein
MMTVVMITLLPLLLKLIIAIIMGHEWERGEGGVKRIEVNSTHMHPHRSTA